MSFDETGLTKGQLRKLNSLRKSVGDDLCKQTSAKWLARQAAAGLKPKRDSVEGQIDVALAGFRQDFGFRLGNDGYTVRRARGQRGAGCIVWKNLKSGQERNRRRDKAILRLGRLLGAGVRSMPPRQEKSAEMRTQPGPAAERLRGETRPKMLARTAV